MKIEKSLFQENFNELVETKFQENPTEYFPGMPFDDQIFKDSSDISILPQSNVIEIIDSGIYPNLAQAIFPLCSAIGTLNNKSRHLGNCVLISKDLVIVPYQLVMEFPIKDLRVEFGLLQEDSFSMHSYPMENIIQCNQDLDYAIVKIDGKAGENFNFAKLYLSKPREDLGEYSSSAFLQWGANKQLQVSVNTYQRINLKNRCYPFHRLDTGSRGGLFIHPNGKLVGMFLGLKEGMPNILYMKEIFADTEGIVNAFAKGILSPKDSWNNMKYRIRKNEGQLPGLTVNNLHLLTFPNSFIKFSESLTFSQKIELANAIANHFDKLDLDKNQNQVINWEFQPSELSKDLWEKMKGFKLTLIGIYNNQNRTWEINVFNIFQQNFTNLKI